jgi:hypothetical protein
MLTRLKKFIGKDAYVLYASTWIQKRSQSFINVCISNAIIESIKIPELKQRITKIIANKLGVKIGFDL